MGKQIIVPVSETESKPSSNVTLATQFDKEIAHVGQQEKDVIAIENGCPDLTEEASQNVAKPTTPTNTGSPEPVITWVSPTEGNEPEQKLTISTQTTPCATESCPPSVCKNSVTIKVKDFLGVLGTATDYHIFDTTSETKISEFLVQVANRFGLNLGDFDITYQSKDFSYNLSGFGESEQLVAMGIVPLTDKVYCMSLDIVPTSRKKKSSASTESKIDYGSTTSSSLEFASCSAYINANLVASEILNPKREFVGLKNRNMTCYLNSFLQGLWFTPEFRNIVYNFVYEQGRDNRNRKSLCFPLQKLFLQQQLSIRDSIDTDDLIKTFGWEDRETWNQHDIEELCSIFMENLTTEFHGTSLDGLIQALYFGTLDDYVKCLECERVSQRTDDFLVIPLPIRNFGSLLTNPTLEAALNSFIAYEVLDGNNMYNCSQCQKPCPAHKGLKFNRLPYILSIQLKRFEYDFIKDRRLKLNDRVAFPFVLDMNPYVENPSPDRRESLKADSLRPASMKENGDRTNHSRPSILMEAMEAEVTSGRKATLEVMRKMVEEKGPEVYQLYGVMVHRGGINSGHYYAYMMDFEREVWYRCDDASVRKASVADIEGAFGGVSDDVRELTSAYMLLYRRFDETLNVLPYYLHEMPQHMQEMWTQTHPLDIKLHEEEEIAKNTVRMSCFFKDESSPDFHEQPVQIPKTMSVAEAALFVYQELRKSSDLPPEPDNVQLCRFDKDLRIIENSFEAHQHDLLINALRRIPPKTQNEGLVVEVKKPGDKFEEYSCDDLIFQTHLADCWNQELGTSIEIHLKSSLTADDLRTKVMARFGLRGPLEHMVLVFQGISGFQRVTGDKHPLSLFKFDRITKLFVQLGTEETLSDVLLDFVEMYTKSDTIQICIEMPHVSMDTPLNETKVVEATPVATQEILPKADAPIDLVPKDTQLKEENTKETTGSSAATPEVSQAPEGSGDSVTPVVTPKKKPDHYIKIIDMEVSAEAENFPVYTIRLNTHTPLYTLSAFISQLINVEECNFVFYKADKESTTEIKKMTERIATLKPFERLYVKFERRLKDDEVRMPVYLLRPYCIKYPSQFVAEIVVTLNMTVDEVKSCVMKKLEDLGSTLEVGQFSDIRIRRKLRSNPSKIMRAGTKLKDLFTTTSVQTGELFVQTLDKPCGLSEKVFCLMYRHWHPSTGVLDSIVEVDIFHDYSTDLEEILLSKVRNPKDKYLLAVHCQLRECLSMGDDVELEVAKPDGACYPWDISNRLIQDLAWFSLMPPAKKSLYVYSDELALFVRDKAEEHKNYESGSDADEGERCRPPSSSSLEPQKREAGLRLNLD